MPGTASMTARTRAIRLLGMHPLQGASLRTPAYRRQDADRRSSQRAEEGDQARLVGGGERREAIAGRPGLPIVRQDRVRDRRRPAVVQQRVREAKTPERRGPHLAAAREPLLDAVTERAHVVEAEVGERLERASESAFTGFGPVTTGREWAPAHPIRSKSRLPASSALATCALSGGATTRMKSWNSSTSSPSSSGSATGSQASSEQSPCGQFSVGKNGLVIPI